MEVINNTDEGRFEVSTAGQTARLDYVLKDGVLKLTHTEVPEALEGAGIGTQLVHAAFEHARTQNLRVLPLCSFAAIYAQRHPEYADLLARS